MLTSNGDSPNQNDTQTGETKCSNGLCEFDSHTTTNIITMIKEITFKIDEDNDLYEITVNNKTFQMDMLDNVYDSLYGNLFDELNMLIDKIQ